MTSFFESKIETLASQWPKALGDAVRHGSNALTGASAAERHDLGYHDVVAERRLREALQSVPISRVLRETRAKKGAEKVR